MTPCHRARRIAFAANLVGITLLSALAAPASAVELSRTDYDTLGAPIDPEIAGLDTQNGPDVVVGNGSPGIQVFLNDGLGSLGSPASMPVACRFGGIPQVELAAVNIHDVYVDIITGCESGFRGNGDGTFTAYNAGSFARNVLMDLGDINTTTASIPDIATTCGDGLGADVPATQSGNTDGTFGFAECVPRTRPDDGNYDRVAVEMEIYNLANDGYTDVVYFDQSREYIIGNEWNTDLHPETGYKVRGSARPTNGTNGVAVETGDLDGDTDPDWVAAMRGPPAMLSVFEHQVNGFPAEAGGGKLINTIGEVEDLELADVNRDGMLDAVTVSQNGVGVQLGNGDRTFKTAQTFPFAAGAGVGHNLATGDLNGDGLHDIVATTNTTADVSVFLSVPTDDTGPPPGTEPPGGTPPGNGDTTEPDLGSSSAKSKQKLGKALKVTVISSEDAALTASATATPKGSSQKRAKKLKFKSASAQAKAGTPVTLKLKPSKKTARKLKAAAKAKARIALSATDAAGNTATETLRVKLR
jgi:hypothetical protein